MDKTQLDVPNSKNMLDIHTQLMQFQELNNIAINNNTYKVKTKPRLDKTRYIWSYTWILITWLSTKLAQRQHAEISLHQSRCTNWICHTLHCMFNSCWWFNIDTHMAQMLLSAQCNVIFTTTAETSSIQCSKSLLLRNVMACNKYVRNLYCWDQVHGDQTHIKNVEVVIVWCMMGRHRAINNYAYLKNWILLYACVWSDLLLNVSSIQ